MKMKWGWEEKRQSTSYINGSVWSEKIHRPKIQDTNEWIKENCTDRGPDERIQPTKSGDPNPHEIICFKNRGMLTLCWFLKI